MSRRIIVSSENTEPEIRQRGYVYQKGRKKSDPWIPDKRAYGFYRIDMPGQTKQKEIRLPLGFCRDRRSAELKLHQHMQKKGVLDPEKIRERITPATTFRQQSEWMIGEMEAGHIVNKKTREPIGERTIDYYSKAIAYLNGFVGDEPLAGLDNPEARDLVAKMKSENECGEPWKQSIFVASPSGISSVGTKLRTNARSWSPSCWAHQAPIS